MRAWWFEGHALSSKSHTFVSHRFASNPVTPCSLPICACSSLLLFFFVCLPAPLLCSSCPFRAFLFLYGGFWREANISAHSMLCHTWWWWGVVVSCIWVFSMPSNDFGGVRWVSRPLTQRWYARNQCWSWRCKMHWIGGIEIATTGFAATNSRVFVRI